MSAKAVITKANVPIKIWSDLHTVESAALDQLTNTANLPFVFKHVAAMPDVHLGHGATVGSVIATKGAICPAAVGVDIGCFTGDTKVTLLDNKEHELSSLVGKDDIYVWACKPDGEVVAAKATALKTRSNASLVKVTLDNNEVIRCTPDHKFLLRDGTYKQAKDLVVQESLMPLYRYISEDGYVLIRQNNTGKTQVAHWVAGRSGILGNKPDFKGQKPVIHHKDFNKANNHPTNLQFMGDADHSALHASIVERNMHWNSASFLEKRRMGIERSKSDPAITAKRREIGAKQWIQFAKTQKFKELSQTAGKRGRASIIAFSKSDIGRKQSSENARRHFTCTDCGEVAEKAGGFGLHWHRKNKHNYNHKVIAVEVLNEQEDVYCLQVPGYNNFALSAGVFVHNCGMIAAKTDLDPNVVQEKIATIRKSIERSVPVGTNGNNKLTNGVTSWVGWKTWKDLTVISHGSKDGKEMLSRAQSQLGSLGGGNHFIEVCLDTDNNVWVMLHSGSRNVGKVVAERHIDKAKSIMKQMFISLPDPDLAYFAQSTEEFKNYLADLEWCQDYAAQNRSEMMTRVLKDLSYAVHGTPDGINVSMRVNCHHNYASRENHYGENVIVTRKGAVRAREGDLGIIPGSMGTRSYIVRGLGNPESFCSCSHGAGRRMSRGEAKRRFTVEDLREQTSGVECRKDEGVLDEIPGAYKDIDEVMENQKDLVEVVAQLKQIMCIKG